MYPHTITVINLTHVKGRYQAHYKELTGVLYQDKQGIKTGTEIAYTDNRGYVQIPHEVEGYVSPQEYEELEDKAGKWTLREGDMIYKGSLTPVPFPELENIEGLRLIDSYENIDYSIVVGNHFGVTLK